MSGKTIVFGTAFVTVTRNSSKDSGENSKTRMNPTTKHSWSHQKTSHSTHEDLFEFLVRTQAPRGSGFGLWTLSMGRAADHLGPGAHVPTCKKRKLIKKCNFFLTSIVLCPSPRSLFLDWSAVSPPRPRDLRPPCWMTSLPDLPEYSLPLIFDPLVTMVISMTSAIIT